MSNTCSFPNCSNVSSSGLSPIDQRQSLAPHPGGISQSYPPPAGPWHTAQIPGGIQTWSDLRRSGCVSRRSGPPAWCRVSSRPVEGTTGQVGTQLGQGQMTLQWSYRTMTHSIGRGPCSRPWTLSRCVASSIDMYPASLGWCRHTSCCTPCDTRGRALAEVYAQ